MVTRSGTMSISFILAPSMVPGNTLNGACSFQFILAPSMVPGTFHFSFHFSSFQSFNDSIFQSFQSYNHANHSNHSNHSIIQAFNHSTIQPFNHSNHSNIPIIQSLNHSIIQSCMAHSLVPCHASNHHGTFTGALSFNQAMQIKFNQTMQITMQNTINQSGVGGWDRNSMR